MMMAFARRHPVAHRHAGPALKTALLAVAVVPNAAAGQETGIHIWTAPRAEVPTSKLSPADSAREVLREFAACAVDRDPHAAKLFLEQAPGSKSASKFGSALSTNECLYNANLRFDTSALRGEVFGALYRKAYKYDTQALSATAIDYWQDVKETDAKDAARYVALRQFADCLVRKDTEQSRALVMAPVASAKENAALNSVMPDLGPCMVSGATVGFDKASLIGLVAEILYRLSTPANSGIH